VMPVLLGGSTPGMTGTTTYLAVLVVPVVLTFRSGGTTTWNSPLREALDVLVDASTLSAIKALRVLKSDGARDGRCQGKPKHGQATVSRSAPAATQPPPADYMRNGGNQFLIPSPAGARARKSWGANRANRPAN
jgi:hypothetical protein